MAEKITLRDVVETMRDFPAEVAHLGERVVGNIRGKNRVTEYKHAEGGMTLFDAPGMDLVSARTARSCGFVVVRKGVAKRRKGENVWEAKFDDGTESMWSGENCR
jgi:hypothetical protein